MDSDASLIRQARKRPEAFSEVYERHADRVHRWLRARTNDDQIALELTAETFAQAIVGLKRFEDRAGGSAGPWLFGIAANLLRRYHRERRVENGARRALGLPLSYSESEFEAVDERDRSERLRPAMQRAVDRLPEGQRRALELRVVGDLSFADVAASLGCSQLAARLRVSRALSTLSQALKGAPR